MNKTNLNLFYQVLNIRRQQWGLTSGQMNVQLEISLTA